MFPMTDTLAERVLDKDAGFVAPGDMLAELRDDNKEMSRGLRQARGQSEKYGDMGLTSAPEVMIGEPERRVCFLFEASRRQCISRDFKQRLFSDFGQNAAKPPVAPDAFIR